MGYKALIKKSIGRIKQHAGRFLSPQRYKSIGFLSEYLGDEVVLNDQAKAIKDKIVSHICTFQSTFFPKNNACLVYINPVYGNSDTLKYATRAMSQGALVLITDQPYLDYPCIISNDPIKTYALLCKYYRDLSPKVKITAVTGSIGKTTTKNMIGEVYKSFFKTLYTEENNNTKTTVGFAVQHIPRWAEMMVQEVHEGEPNETQWLSMMLHPEVVVLTSIDNSHYQFFGSPDRIIQECCSITRFMSEKGTVIVNKDEFDRFDLLNGQRVMTVSTMSEDADIYASQIEVNDGGLSFLVHIKEKGITATVELNNIYARHNVVCALYAFAAGYSQGIPVDTIVSGLKKYKTSGIRQNIIKTTDGVTLYIDCYNAVAKSMKSAIDACDLIPVSGKRIAVLGDIAEVGNLSEKMHQDVISFVNKSKFNVLYAYGPNIKAAIDITTLRNSLQVSCFDRRESLSEELKKSVSAGDLVLFKASNSSGLGELVIKVWPYLKDVVHNKKRH